MSGRPGRGTFLAVAGAAILAQAAAVMVVVGLNFGVTGPPAPEPAAAEPATAPVAAAQAPADMAGTMPWAEQLPQVRPMVHAIPVHLTVSRLGIDTDLMSLGLNPDGTVEVPPDSAGSPAGWYRNLAAPGETGPAVILGHVDSRTGPGVFYPLGASRPGDEVVVSRADGTQAVFRVDRVATFPRAAFPTAEVYGAVGHPGLRLVTCGGEYDRDNGGYQNNVVVFASLAGAHVPY
jgi:hypothetical protein